MPAILATRVIVSQRSLPAERHQVERRILLLAQSSGPEVAPLAQDVVDGRVDAVYMNTHEQGAQDMNQPFNSANGQILLIVLNR
jgi:hypothetical protein